MIKPIDEIPKNINEQRKSYGERGFCKNEELIRQTTFYCADGERREYVKPPTESATDWNGVECE